MRDPAFRARIAAHRPCPPCRAKLLARMKADIAGQPLLSIVIPVLDEDPAEVQLTLKTIRDGTGEPLEIILIDDHSKVPVPDATIRNATRLGATRSRKLGCELATGKFVAILDSHMKIGVGNLRKLCALAEAKHGIAYCGCNGHHACELREIGGILESKWWRPPAGVEHAQSTGLMGACYVVERAVLMERMGGFVGLPGPLGSQELSFAIQAAKCGVPIWCDLTLDNWHHFRKEPSAPVPWNLYLLNVAATYRLLFSDDSWRVLRARLCNNPGTQKRLILKPDIIRQAEGPDFVAYGKQLRAKQTVSDYEFGQRFKLDLPKGNGR